MAPQQKRTYFLYSLGTNTDELTLGSLVLNYHDPLLSYRYIHPPLGDDAIDLHATTTRISECMLSSETGNTFNVNLDLAELANVGFGFGGKDTIIVVGKNGKRLRLRDPEKFLNEVVLSTADAQKHLRRWLSAAMKNRVTAAMKRLQKPRIWLLTGLYHLDDVTTFTISEAEPSMSLGITAATMAALSGVPIGGSIAISNRIALRAKMKVPDTCVWAAQYQRLKVQYFWPGKEPELPNLITLYNTYSCGVAFSDEDPETYLQPECAAVSADNMESSSVVEGPPASATSWVESELWVEEDESEVDGARPAADSESAATPREH